MVEVGGLVGVSGRTWWNGVGRIDMVSEMGGVGGSRGVVGGGTALGGDSGGELVMRRGSGGGGSGGS